MKASELRIGNWVEYNDDEIGKVICVQGQRGTSTPRISIGISENLWFTEEPEHIKPIPLTEEWLVKFGFENKGLVMSGAEWFTKKQKHKWKKELRIAKDRTGGWWTFTMECVSPPTLSLVDIKYVHQLQNLYFTLAGEELEIKKD